MKALHLAWGNYSIHSLGKAKMPKLLVVIVLASSAAVTAADIDTKAAATDDSDLTAQCIGLESAGERQCIQIIYRYKYGPPATPHKLTLAENTGINAIMKSDPLAILVMLPDGSYTIGHVLSGDTLANRFFYIPCNANPCPK
jgi:hypothetical protein